MSEEKTTPEVKPFEETLKEKFNLTETELTERLTKYSEFETKIPEYETQLNEKTTALGKYEGNPFVKTLAEVAETNPDNLKTYVELSSVDVDKMDGLDAKK